VLLAAYTYLSGLRAPALIAFIKDTLIYVMIVVAIIYIPTRLGGWGHIFSTAGTHLAKTSPKTGKPFGSLTVGPTAVWAYSSLALGSALALLGAPTASGRRTRDGDCGRGAAAAPWRRDRSTAGPADGKHPMGGSSPAPGGIEGSPALTGTMLVARHAPQVHAG
jgi:hypothetical protein